MDDPASDILRFERANHRSVLPRLEDCTKKELIELLASGPADVEVDLAHASRLDKRGHWDALPALLEAHALAPPAESRGGQRRG